MKSQFNRFAEFDKVSTMLQMCPFLLNFRFSLNKALLPLNRENSLISPNENALKELNVWKGFLLDKDEWFPICHFKTTLPFALKLPSPTQQVSQRNRFGQLTLAQCGGFR